MEPAYLTVLIVTFLAIAVASGYALYKLFAPHR